MLDKVLWQGSLLLARLGGVLLVATALLVSVEVVLRKLGIAAFSVGSELSSYALAISATWAFALVLMVRGHVRIDILTARLPAGPRAFVNVLAVASLAAVGVVLSYSAFGTFMRSFELGAISNTTLATPLWVPQGLWLAGLLWFTLVAAYRTVVLVAALLRGDFATVERLAAPASADDEADSAVSEARERFAHEESRP